MGELMKLEDHPAIRASWSSLAWSKSGGGPFGQVNVLDSILTDARIIQREQAVQLTRDQDGATATLLCEDASLLPNLEGTLQKCIGTTVREISQREVGRDLILI